MTPEEHVDDTRADTRTAEEAMTGTAHDRERRAQERASIAELLQRLTRDATTLVRDEVELVRAETRESIDRTRHSLTQFMSAAVFFLIGGVALTAALIIGLSEFVDPWIAALGVGLVALIIGWALRSRAASNLSAEALKPSRTGHAMRRDRELLKEKLS